MKEKQIIEIIDELIKYGKKEYNEMDMFGKGWWCALDTLKYNIQDDALSQLNAGDKK